MKFSQNWLLEWIDPQVSNEALTEKLTSLGFEVESVTPAAPTFDDVVIAQIISAERHPDAEKLQVCKVTDGHETYQIVCGAKNARADLRVALAKVGAKLPNGMQISKAKLRGVESSGMLCSTNELGLSETSEGIFELPAAAPLGKNIRDYLNLDDSMIDLAITPNRGDALSIKGLAREISVAYQLPFTQPVIKEVKCTATDTMTVKVDAPAICPRYCGRIIRSLNAHAVTPLWLQEKLRRSGLRSIHPVVDIVNYVMLELGQPMHAFDLSKITGNIQVRFAHDNENLTLLDTRTVALRKDTLVITDAKKPLAIAGVMGGLDSSVTAQTTDIFLESAFFSPDYMMGHARYYNLTTDASQRFERGVDPQITCSALQRATQLILEICGGEAGNITEQVTAAQLPQSKKISLRRARIVQILGMTISDADVVRILQHLDMKVNAQTDGWEIMTPLHRFDLNLEVDLIEELARVYGYKNIPAQFPMAQLIAQVPSALLRDTYTLKQQLANLGYFETLTYSFIDPKWQELLFPQQSSLNLINPLSTDLSVMRTSLWPNLLAALVANQNYQQERVRLFEIGRVFLPVTNGLEQPLKIAGLAAGTALPEQWASKTRNLDFFDVKGDLELFLQPSGEVSFVTATHPVLHPGQSAEILIGNISIGWVGRLHPRFAQTLKLSGAIFLFELDLEKLNAIPLPIYQTVSKFPAIRRDLSVVLGQDITFSKLYDIVKTAAGSLLTQLTIFDLYQGREIGAEQKSIALSLTLQHPQRTLVDDEVAAVVDAVLKQITEVLKGHLRA